VITDFKIGNKPVSINDSKKILAKPIEMTEKIVLHYSDNMISFDFAAMDFTQPSKNLYQYKLDGFDHEWIQSGTVHSATYTNLDPGTYTFHVKGSNSDGVWNEKGTSIMLEIFPPWYMTWWFRTLVVIIIVAAAYSFYRYRLQQALKLQAIRNKIASDLHDEIGSNLSSISIFSDVAKEETQGTAVGTVLSKISSYTRESMEAMSDIVWMINASNDRFENIINKMREFAVELIEAKKCFLQLNIDDHLNNIKLGMQERKNFWLI
jgi:Y_Y_Y domain/Histidine kinase